MENTTDLPWAQLGMLVGGMLTGLVFGIFWLARHFPRSKDKKSKDSGEYLSLQRREEWTLELSKLEARIEETAVEAREAKAAATAVQASLTIIGQMIDSATKTLGDRIEAALLDVRERIDEHAESFTDHHGRLRAIETELQLRRHE